MQKVTNRQSGIVSSAQKCGASFRADARLGISVVDGCAVLDVDVGGAEVGTAVSVPSIVGVILASALALLPSLASSGHTLSECVL